MRTTYGKIHSIETLGTRDGPGLRMVFFLAGCNFRCKFCHNADTWTETGAKRVSLEEIEEKLSGMLPYLRQQHGGITVSGGEPSRQTGFVIALFKLAHKMKLSTALDTNGTCPASKRDALLAETDIVLLDVKASEPRLHRWLTKGSLKTVLEFGRLSAKNGTPELIIRRVLLPGINDTEKELRLLTSYLKSLPVRPKVELIPYHRLGAHKWKALGKIYPLENLKPPTSRQKQRVIKFLRQHGFKVLTGEK